MVNYAVAPEMVMPKACELAQELADGPTWAIRWSKPQSTSGSSSNPISLLDASLAYEMMPFRHPHQKEAVKAFMEKRKPNFVEVKED